MSSIKNTADIISGHLGTLVNDQYFVKKKLGGGSFGDIYLGVDRRGDEVAMKFEKVTTRCPQLRHEYKVYRELQNFTGISKVHYFGTHNSHNVMVMDLLGPSLEDLFTKCGRRFSLKTVLQIADQLLERIETMHNRHLIHRDVKPGNFCIGAEKRSDTVYTIDFGLSTRYRHPQALQHIPYREGRNLTGTPRYASINNHLGCEQSRRDDLESIGYVLIYFLKGSLPWQGLKARNAKRKYKLIMEKKQMVSIQQLCNGLPQQFAEYMAYCRSLKFEAKPNMSYLRSLFRDLYKRHDYSPNLDGSLDWDWYHYPNMDSVPEEDRIEQQMQRPRESPPPPKNERNSRSNGINGLASPHATTQYATIGTNGKSPSAAYNCSQSDNIQEDISNRLNTAVSLRDESQKNSKSLKEETKISREDDFPPQGMLKNSRHSNGYSTNAGWSMWNLKSKSGSGGLWGSSTKESNHEGSSPKKLPKASLLNLQPGTRPNTAPGKRYMKFTATPPELQSNYALTSSKVVKYLESQGVLTSSTGLRTSRDGWVSSTSDAKQKSTLGARNGVRPSTSSSSRPLRGMGQNMGAEANVGLTHGPGNPFDINGSPALSTNDSSSRLHSQQYPSKTKVASSSKKKLMQQPAPFTTGKKY